MRGPVQLGQDVVGQVGDQVGKHHPWVARSGSGNLLDRSKNNRESTGLQGNRLWLLPQRNQVPISLFQCGCLNHLLASLMTLSSGLTGAGEAVRGDWRLSPHPLTASSETPVPARRRSAAIPASSRCFASRSSGYIHRIIHPPRLRIG